MPRSYQVTAKVLGRRRATEGFPVRPARRRSTEESARRQPENQPQRSDVTAQTQGDSDSDSTLDFPLVAVIRTETERRAAGRMKVRPQSGRPLLPPGESERLEGRRRH